MTSLVEVSVLILGSMSIGTWFQWWNHRRLGPKRLAGDEGEYLKRGKSDDPFGPDPFIRVPVMALLARFCSRFSDAERAFRLIIQAASLISVAATALCGWLLGGFWLGLLAGMLFLIHPERMILSGHLWPDPLLAMHLSIINLWLIALAAFGFWSTLGMGCLVGLAVATRIDALALLAGICASLMCSDSDLPPLLVIPPLIIPSAIFLGLYAWRNGRRYGTCLPDTTFMFNLRLAQAELNAGSNTSGNLDAAIALEKKQWDMTSPSAKIDQLGSHLATLMRHPLRSFLGFLSRIWLYLGPDSFIRQKLFSTAKGAYPHLGGVAGTMLRFVLYAYTPVLLAWSIAVFAALGGVPSKIIWPILALGLIGCLVHTRTRFRLAVMPTVCLIAALACQRIAEIPINGWSAVAGMSAVVWLCLIFSLPRREEVRG